MCDKCSFRECPKDRPPKTAEELLAEKKWRENASSRNG
jgi:hypothetical protein